jgi:hypothetical protein
MRKTHAAAGVIAVALIGLAKPVCAQAPAVDAVVQAPRVTEVRCANGRVANAQTEWHCCWPGQVLNRSAGVCAGMPRFGVGAVGTVDRYRLPALDDNAAVAQTVEETVAAPAAAKRDGLVMAGVAIAVLGGLTGLAGGATMLFTDNSRVFDEGEHMAGKMTAGIGVSVFVAGILMILAGHARRETGEETEGVQVAPVASVAADGEGGVVGVAGAF